MFEGTSSNFAIGSWDVHLNLPFNLWDSYDDELISLSISYALAFSLANRLRGRASPHWP